jgi:hypothetical protein
MHRVWPAQHLRGLREPCVSLLGEAARLVLGFAGFQGGLLRQLQRFHRRGRPAMRSLEIGGKDAAPGLDRGSTGRPAGDQDGVDANDLTYRLLPHILVGTFGESEAEAFAEVVL